MPQLFLTGYDTETTVVLLIGIILGAALGWLLVRFRRMPRLMALKAENTFLSTQIHRKEEEIQEQKAIAETLRAELAHLRNDVLNMTQQHATAVGRLDRLASLEALLDDKDKKIESLQITISDLKANLAELKTHLANQQEAFDEKTALLKDLRSGLTETHRAISAEALQQNNQAFLDLARTTFSKYLESAKTDFTSREKAVKDTILPIKEALDRYDRQIQEMERARENAYGGLARQVESLIQTQEILQKETGKLVNALRVPHVRGRWGEITLKRVAEMAGMQSHCDFFEQSSTQTDDGRLRPDMIVYLPGQRNIIIDAKVPLSAYLEALEAETEEEKESKLVNHARQVAVHIKKLSQKAYWTQFETTPEFVVLFIPGENFFAAALAHNPKLIEWGVRDGVVLATPTTLISLLKTVAYGWQQEKMAENARKISILASELFERLSTMSRHINTLGRDIERSVKTYNQVVGSLERRVFSSARKFKALGVSSREDAPPMTAAPVATDTRRIQLDEDQ